VDTLTLMNNKISYLRRFLEINENFLISIERNHSADFEGLHLQRESMIKEVLLLDKKISESVRKLSISDKNNQLIESLKNLIYTQEKLIKSIFSSDEKIICKIEVEKKKLLKELNDSEREKEIVKKFRSTWIPESGAKLDGVG